MTAVPFQRATLRGLALALAATASLGLGAQARPAGPRTVSPGDSGRAAPGSSTAFTGQTGQAFQPGSARATGAGDSAALNRAPASGDLNARPTHLGQPMTGTVYRPRPLPRSATQPLPAFWRNRDLFAEMRYLARRGFIEVVPVGEEITGITGATWFPSGWKAYGFTVPGRETLHVRLRHPNEGWFRLLMVNKWGQIGEGMLQNLIPTGNPEVTFKSLRDETQNVYVIVDDPGWMSSRENPFNLTVERSWDPAKRKAEPPVPQVVGIWAARKVEPKAKPEADKAAIPPAADPKG